MDTTATSARPMTATSGARAPTAIPTTTESMTNAVSWVSRTTVRKRTIASAPDQAERERDVVADDLRHHGDQHGEQHQRRGECRRDVHFVARPPVDQRHQAAEHRGQTQADQDPDRRELGPVNERPFEGFKHGVSAILQQSGVRSAPA